MSAIGYQHIKTPRRPERQSVDRQSVNRASSSAGIENPVTEETPLLSSTTTQPAQQIQTETPRFIPLTPSDNMTDFKDGFVFTAPDGRILGFGCHKIGSLGKNEDFGTPFLIEGDDKPLSETFLKKDDGLFSCITNGLQALYRTSFGGESSAEQEFNPVPFLKDFFQKTMDKSHQDGIAFNESDPANQGGACVVFGAMTNRWAVTANAGDSTAGIVSFIEPSLGYPARSEFIEMTERHAIGHPAGDKDFQDTLAPQGFYKSDNGVYTYNPHTHAGLQVTRGMADDASRYKGFPLLVRWFIEGTATNLVPCMKNLFRNDHVCFYSDGLDLNNKIQKPNASLLRLPDLKDCLETQNPKQLTDVIDKENKKYPRKDDQIMFAFSPKKLKDNEMIVFIGGDGHGGSHKITQNAVQHFYTDNSNRFKKVFPNGIVCPVPTSEDMRKALQTANQSVTSPQSPIASSSGTNRMS